MLDKQIINFLSQQLGIKKEEVTLDSDFFSDLNVEKLQLADLLLAAEQEFQVTFPPKTLPKIQKVKDLLKIIKELNDELN